MKRKLLLSTITFFCIGLISAQQAGTDTTATRFTAPRSAVLIGSFYSLCAPDIQLGLEASALYRTNKKPRLMLGLNGSLTLAAIFRDRGTNTAHPVTLYYLGGKIAWRKNKMLYITVDPGVLLGKEQRTQGQFMGNPISPVTYRTTEEKLFTIQLGTGVMILMPADSQGLFFAGQLWLRGSTGTLFDAAAGLRLSVGVRI